MVPDPYKQMFSDGTVYMYLIKTADLVKKAMLQVVISRLVAAGKAETSVMGCTSNELFPSLC